MRRISNSFDLTYFIFVFLIPVFYGTENFVLQNFPKEQLEELKEILKRADEAIEFYLKNDIQKAQNKFN